MSVTAAQLLRGAMPVEDVPASFCELLEERFTRRAGERFVVLLSGGPTAAACYARATKAHIDWSLVDVYMGDERMVAANDEAANQRLVREHLIDQVGRVGSFTPMVSEGDPAQCASEYDAILRGVFEGPGIDLIHLGLGPDGHTASLFPGSPSLAEADRLVVATSDPNGKNPHQRLTVTYPLIDSARTAVFTVVGPEKHDAVARLRAGEDLPAARVAASEICWLLDARADGGTQTS